MIDTLGKTLNVILFLTLIPLALFSQKNKTIDSLIEVLETNITEIEKVKTLVSLSKRYSGNVRMDYAKRAYEISNTDASVMISATQLAWALKSDYKYDSAKYFVKIALKIGERQAVSIELSDTYNTYGSIYYNTSNLDSAIIMHRKALQIRQNLNDNIGVAASLNNLSIVYVSKGERALAISMIKQSIYTYEKAKAYKSMSDSYLNLGTAYTNLGELDSAYYYFQKSLIGYDSLKEENLKTYAMINLAFVCNDLKKKEEAIQYFRQTAKIQKAIQNQAILGYAYEGLGSLQREKGKTDSAIFHLEKGLIHFTNAKSENGQSMCYNNLGKAYQDKGDFESAIKYFNLSLALKEALNLPEGLIEINLSLGSIYTQMKQYKQSELHLNKALKIAQEVKNISSISKVHFTLYQLYKSSNNYQAALKNHEEHTFFQDSLLNVQNLATVEQLNVQYETERKEEKIKLQSLEISAQKITNDRNYLLIIALFIGLVLVIIIGVLIKTRLSKKQLVALKQKDIDFKELQLIAVIDSQEKERKRFATDLHDGFGQLISILKLNVESIEQQQDQVKRHTLLEKSTSILNDMYGELRSICFNLMPQSLVKFGLLPSLKEFADKINISEKVIVEILAYDMEERLSNLQEISLYRITQEWVNNILKYSDADKITIQITKDESEITLTIEDNGTGFDLIKLTESKGNGWKNMRSRTNLIHADLDIDTTPQVKGNMLMINLPVALTKEVVELG